MSSGNCCSAAHIGRVELEFRRRGVFRALLHGILAVAERHNAHELILEYSASNKQLKAAWTWLGFKTTGVRASAFTSTAKAALEP